MDLSRQKLTRASLRGANLRGASLCDANLSEADLYLAELKRTDLQGANLSEANLSSADLSDANLRGANLSGAKVTNEQLAKAKSLQDAIMPDGTKCTLPDPAGLAISPLLEDKLREQEKKSRQPIYEATGGQVRLVDLGTGQPTRDQSGHEQLTQAALSPGAVMPTSIKHDQPGLESASGLPVSGEIFQEPKAAIPSIRKSTGVQEALEGKIYKTETTFRRRNRALIDAKKAHSDGRCEVCGFRFEDQYGSAYTDCLVAHHINPIAHRSGPSKTSLDDIALLCPNCHVVVHTQDPPISLEGLRETVRKH